MKEAMEESARLRAKELQRVQRSLKIKQDLVVSREEAFLAQSDRYQTSNGAYNISNTNIEINISKND